MQTQVQAQGMRQARQAPLQRQQQHGQLIGRSLPGTGTGEATLAPLPLAAGDSSGEAGSAACARGGLSSSRGLR